MSDTQTQAAPVESQAAAPVAAPAAAAAPPADLLYVPGEAYTYIPWRMLTREALDACFQLKALVDNKKKNPNAQGSSIWAKFDLRKFKSMHPGFQCKLNDDRLCIRTPFMHSPFAISCFPGKEGGDNDTISLSYGRARDDDVEAFANWSQNVFDAWLMDKIVENSKKWLGQTQTLDLIKVVYCGLYRFTEEDDAKGYAAKTGGFKLLPKTKQPNFKAFHGPTEIVPTPKNPLRDSIHPNDYFQLDVELSTVWFVKPRCGVSGNISRIDMRTPDEMQQPGFAIILPPPQPEADPVVSPPAVNE